jgi:hypothetical protein
MPPPPKATFKKYLFVEVVCTYDGEKGRIFSKVLMKSAQLSWLEFVTRIFPPESNPGLPDFFWVQYT